MSSPFPTAPLRTVLATFTAHGSPASPVSSASALRITRTFAVTRRSYLTPFALWTAFPSSDYYGVSVALSLAAVRRSRVPHSVDVQDGLGALFVSLFRPLQTVQLPWSANGLHGTLRPFWGKRPDDNHRFRPAWLQFGHWGSGNSAFTMPSGPCRTCRLAASWHSGFPDMLLSPVAFAFR